MSAIDWSLQALRTFPRTLHSFIVDIPQNAFDFRPVAWDGIPSELLTIRQQICHLRDIEADGYFVRFSRVLREADPTLDSIDTYELVERRNYDQTGIDDALKAFTDARAGTMRLLDGLTPSDLERRAQFEGYGTVTLAGLVHYLSSHDQQHLSGIQWLLGKHAASNASYAHTCAS